MSTSIDSILFFEAKNLLRKHHTNFSELKAQTRKMLETHLQLSPSGDLVEWLAYIIRSEDWKSFSVERIKNFDNEGKDFSDWLAFTLGSGNPKNKWFKPYVEKEEITKANTLSDKLTIGMRGSYWLENNAKAKQTLEDAIEQLKNTRFEPADDFKFADYYLEMVNNGRYSECCDLIGGLHNITLDDLSKERILAQAIGCSMRCGRTETSGLAVEIAVEMDFFQREVLPFNIACYYATVGNDEDLMYKYIQIAVENGKNDYDFDDSDFDAHRHKAKFKVLIKGGSMEKAEKQEKAAGAIKSPETLDEAVALINELRSVAEKVDARRADRDNVIVTLLGVESASYDDEPEAVPVLNMVVEKFGNELPSQALVDLFIISFPDMTLNYQVALDAVDELIRRKDTKAQMAVADAFMKAGTYYDAGHRPEENSVQDQLIDNYFPQFTNEALIYLLEICDTQYLAADGMSHLFVSLLNRDPSDEDTNNYEIIGLTPQYLSDDIKQRAYKCFEQFYEKEGDTDYYFYQFKYLLEELAPLLPADVLEKVKNVNPEMWEKFQPGNPSDEDDANVEDDSIPEENRLQNINAGIGFTGTLIKNECDYAVYACHPEGTMYFYCMCFYPDGHASNYVVWDDLTKAVIVDTVSNLEDGYDNGKGQYIVRAGDVQVDGTQPADKIEFAEMGFSGGWDSKGELILISQDNMYPYQYIGHVTNEEMVFDKSCNIE